MYDPEIYRQQMAEYFQYNPYVLDADMQAGEFYLNMIFFFYVTSVWKYVIICFL